MKFETPLLKGSLLKRYQRFLADVELENGEKITAHCPNSGSMLGLKEPGIGVWVSQVPNHLERKLRYTLEVVEVDGSLVGVNTGKPNNLVEEAFINKKIPEFSLFTAYKREVKYGENSRIDFLFYDESEAPCYVEVKSVTLKQGNVALFPDAVTSRGAKHLKELAKMVQQGARAIIFYVVQREDCSSFSIASSIDQNYAEMTTYAKENGVESLCYHCKIALDEIKIFRPLPIVDL